MTTELIFKDRIPGNNDKDGLLRMHWTKRNALKNRLKLEAMSQCRTLHPGPLRLELIRHSVGRPMDYDNLVSTGKPLLDALVAAGILPDDNPQVIVQREYTQTKAIKRGSQMTVVRLIQLS